MGIPHNVLFRNQKKLTYVSPDFLRRGATNWAQRTLEGQTSSQHLGKLPTTWLPWYTQRAEDILDTRPPPVPPQVGRMPQQIARQEKHTGGRLPPASWTTFWRPQNMRMCLARGAGVSPRQSRETCKAFDKWGIPFRDKDFIRRVLWAKLLVVDIP